MRIAIVGNSPTNSGVALAADWALAGHDISLSSWKDGEIDFATISRAGGIHLHGETRHLLSGVGGLARIKLFELPREALREAELIVLDCLPIELESCVRAVASSLVPGQIVHFNQANYCSALRVAPIIEKAGARGVVLTESTAPIISASCVGNVVTVSWLRKNLKISAFPSAKSERAFSAIEQVYPSLRRAANVLETSFSNLNLLVHPSVALLNVARMDKVAECGGEEGFWIEGPSASTEQLSIAQDHERKCVFDSYHLGWASTLTELSLAYDMQGGSLRQVQETNPYYLSLPKRAADIWRKWLFIDIAMGHAPFLEFAKLAGVAVPIHESYLTLFDVLLKPDPSIRRLGLSDFGLNGATKADVLHYLESGADRR